jgi:hypothetical protein
VSSPEFRGYDRSCCVCTRNSAYSTPGRSRSGRLCDLIGLSYEQLSSSTQPAQADEDGAQTASPSSR